MTEQPQIHILLADDSEDDILLTKRAFESVDLASSLHIVNNGEEVLKYLYNRDPYSDPSECPKPSLIILDINMPKMNGIMVLENIKKDPDLKTIPCIMFTSSKREQDVVDSFGKGAASYLQKPVSYEALIDMIKGFEFYWRSVSKLPKQ